jgi:hypothetical protein
MRVLASAAVAIALMVVSGFVSAAETRQRGSVGADTVGLERAHAHNDYEHDRSLYDALDHRFKSVEADIWLVDGELVVAHDAEDVPQAAEQGITLRSLYLEPLRQRVKQNRGSVYRGGP